MVVMQRYEKRNIDVGGYTVEFYFWGDAITPAIKVSIVEETTGWFRKRYKKLYSESHLRGDITSFKVTAEKVVENYKKELEKWKQ